ncbi:MAG: DUF5719 family protein [Actinomycetota bacterium]|nr:DUF5719 family protein [Actinomycetota bacterium]
MRRVIAGIIVAVVGALAFAQAGPIEVRPPDFGAPPPEVSGATGDPSAWYCPWVASGALRDSAFNVATAIDVDATITLSNPNPTEEPDINEVRLRGPGARAIDAGDIARRGTSPGVVEFDDGPAVATTAMWSEEILTGDRCVVSVPKEWHLVGGITAEGFTLELQLFNPFAESAKVTVEAITEFGRSPLAGFESIDVPGRSWLTEDLSRLIPFLDMATFTVTVDSGIVIPSLVLNNGTDEASWPGTGQSTVWDFPVTSVPGLEPTLVLSNTGTVEATIAIDLFTPDGPIIDADGRIVSPLEPLRIHLSDLAEPPFAVRVRSNAPIGAVIQAAPEGTFPRSDDVPPVEDQVGEAGDEAEADDEEGSATDEEVPDGAEGEEGEVPVSYDGLAAMPGNTDPLERWLVPGLGVVPGAETSIWILNPSGEDATVTVSPLGVSALRSDKIVIPPGRYVEIPVPELSETGNSGMLIEASLPVSVAVSIAGPQGVAFVGGVGVG